MKTFKRSINAILILISIFVVGIFPSTIVSIFVSIAIDEVKFSDCVSTIVFWLVSIIGWFMYACWLEKKCNE